MQCRSRSLIDLLGVKAAAGVKTEAVLDGIGGDGWSRHVKLGTHPCLSSAQFRSSERRCDPLPLLFLDVSVLAFDLLTDFMALVYLDAS